jgi:hypothetical protein
MSKSTQTTARTSYWSKSKKKTVHKSVNLSKFGGDITKAKEFLAKWKEEELAKDSQKKDVKDTVEIKEEVKPIEEKKEDVIDASVIQKPGEENVGPIPVIQFTEFKLNVPDLKKDACSTVVFGSGKAGKTTQMMKFINEYFSENYIITLVFSPNIHAEVYKPIKSDYYIKIDRWNDQIIRDIHKIQKKTKNKYCFLIVIDDCILEKLSPQILQLLLVLRNSRMNTLLNLQSVTLLSRNGRNNGNNFIFKHCNNDEIIEDAMDYFLGSFPPFYGLKKEQKIKLYREATADHGEYRDFVYLNALDGIVSFHHDYKENL